MRLFYGTVVSLCCVTVALASLGDNLDEFIDCVEACEYQRKCNDATRIHAASQFAHITFDETPILYKLLLWDCSSDCDYQCQQIITKSRIEAQEEIYQFHGKWPFKRSMGLQEFYSTVFSVGNFIPHYQGFKLLKNVLGRVPHSNKNRVLLQNYLLVAISGMLAWTCSSVFHTRDLILTEKLDYFFAGATVLSGFHAIFTRVTRLDEKQYLRKLFSLGTLGVFLLHILRLHFDWSYTYNMRFNVFFGVLQYALLITVSFLNYKALCKSKVGSMRQLVVLPIFLVCFTGIAMSNELFDFFSYTWQIDSHAIWHVLTIFPSFFLYPFFLADYYAVTTKTLVPIKAI